MTVAPVRRIPAARRSPEQVARTWRDYQQPLRWSWTALGVILALLAAHGLLAAYLLGKL